VYILPTLKKLFMRSKFSLCLISTNISKEALTSHLELLLRKEGIIKKEADLSQKPDSQ
jgi:DNA-binding transcriptional ArsR family regulator